MSDDEAQLRRWLRLKIGDAGHLRANTVGHLVVGVGRTVQRQLANGEPGQGIESDLVDTMFERDLQAFRAELAREFWWAKRLDLPRLAVFLALRIELGTVWQTPLRPVLAWMEQAAQMEGRDQREAYLRASQQLIAAPRWPSRSQSVVDAMALQLTTGQWS